MTALPHLAAVEVGDLDEYPLGPDDRLDQHWFMAWERRRWLNSEMRLKATPECRAIYFDLICVSYEQSPIGTLPDDPELLAKLALVEQSHLVALCRMPLGPLHRWQRCLCGDEVRLFHPFVLKTIMEAISRKADNRARMEAANTHKRLQRLRSTVAGFHADLAKNDAAVKWMDQWLQEQGCGYRSAEWVERAMGAWTRHMMDMREARR